ncbi:hypothetical protein GC170_03125 [bacterium]|nr:hypothetical protein [bacterium]
MTGHDRENLRFGQDPADSDRLLRSWNETRPEPVEADWSSFWASAQNEAARRNLQPGQVSGGIRLKLALAASLLIGLSIAGFRNFPRTDELTGGPVTIVAGTQESSVIGDSIRDPQVSIDLGENDSLAVIRVGYEECPMPNPCVESVETYASSGSENGALASNFQLLNEFESIASE